MPSHAGNRPTKNTRFSLQIGVSFQGGTYVGNITVSSVTYGIVLAPISSVSGPIQWKTTNTDSPGTSSSADGWTNTNNMNDANHPAAQYARSLTTNGYNDWYIPSEYELAILISQAFQNGNSLGINGFDTYWSSTQTGESNAWIGQFFNSPSIFVSIFPQSKTENSVKVRAVRRFLI